MVGLLLGQNLNAPWAACGWFGSVVDLWICGHCVDFFPGRSEANTGAAASLCRSIKATFVMFQFETVPHCGYFLPGLRPGRSSVKKGRRCPHCDSAWMAWTLRVVVDDWVWDESGAADLKGPQPPSAAVQRARSHPAPQAVAADQSPAGAASLMGAVARAWHTAGQAGTTGTLSSVDCFQAVHAVDLKASLL